MLDSNAGCWTRSIRRSEAMAGTPRIGQATRILRRANCFCGVEDGAASCPRPPLSATRPPAQSTSIIDLRCPSQGGRNMPRSVGDQALKCVARGSAALPERREHTRLAARMRASAARAVSRRTRATGGVFEAVCHQVRVAHDDRKQVVEFMRTPRRQMSHASTSAA